MSDDSKKRKRVVPAVITACFVTLAFTVSAVYLAEKRGVLHDILSVGTGTGTSQSGPKTVYVGPMHPWIVSDEPGDCPICGMELVPKVVGEDSDVKAKKAERVVVYWRNPDDPSQTFHQSGKAESGKELIPVYQDEVVGGVEIKIDPTTIQNMGLRTAIAEKKQMSRTIRTYGRVTYDETLVKEVNLKFSGWIEKLFVDFSGQLIRKGDALFEIYSPEVVQAAEEYLVVQRRLDRIPGQGGTSLRRSGKRKLQFWDIPESEIKDMEKSGKPKRTVIIRSPFTGVVRSKSVTEGGFVKAGMSLYTIADLSLVWIEVHIYEYELPWVRVGQEVEVSLPYHPGKIYAGRVSYINLYLEAKTRDVVVRVEMLNTDLGLKPDMYADVKIYNRGLGTGLMIPSEAVLRSGERNLVFVSEGKGRFSPRQVTLGVVGSEGKVQVLTGLAPGDRVVTSGQFLLDSESKLQEAVQKMMSYKAEGVEKPAPAKEDDFFSDM